MHHLIHDIKTLGLEMIEGRQVARRLKSLLPVRLKKICAELKKAEEDSHLKKALNERVAKGLDSRHDDASKRSLFKINEHCELGVTTKMTFLKHALNHESYLEKIHEYIEVNYLAFKARIEYETKTMKYQAYRSLRKERF